MSNYYNTKVKNKEKLQLGSIYGVQMNKSDSGSKDDMKETKLKDKSDYYITMTELFYRIKKSGSNPSSTKKAFRFSTNLVRARKGKDMEEEKHDIRAKYIMCVVDESLPFAKLDRRKVNREKMNGHNVAYFIPIHFMRSLLPEKISRYENISVELAEIPIFKYTGEIEMFQSTNVFSLSKEIYLTDKADAESAKIRVII